MKLIYDLLHFLGSSYSSFYKDHKVKNSSSFMIPNQDLLVNCSLNNYNCRCKINVGNSLNVIINCSGSGPQEFSTKQDICPTYTSCSTILALNGLQQIAIWKKDILAMNSTIPIIFAEPNANETTQVPFSTLHTLNELKNTNFWIIIGCQLAVIVMLVAYLLRQRHCGAIQRPMDNVPPPTNEFASPIEEVFIPTPRHTFQHPPPPAEAVYEVNINYGEAPTLQRAKVPVYEDHKFDKNNPRTPQHNIYARTLEQEDDAEERVYSNIKS